MMIHRALTSWMEGSADTPGSAAATEDPVFALARRRNGIARFRVGAAAFSTEVESPLPRVTMPNGVSIARQVESVLMNACPLAKSDRELREAVASDTMNQEFDLIRRRFAGRNEFTESVVPSNLIADQSVHDVLLTLGFRSPRAVP